MRESEGDFHCRVHYLQPIDRMRGEHINARCTCKTHPDAQPKPEPGAGCLPVILGLGAFVVVLSIIIAIMKMG